MAKNIIALGFVLVLLVALGCAPAAKTEVPVTVTCDQFSKQANIVQDVHALCLFLNEGLANALELNFYLSVFHWGNSLFHGHITFSRRSITTLIRKAVMAITTMPAMIRAGAD